MAGGDSPGWYWVCAGTGFLASRHRARWQSHWLCGCRFRSAPLIARRRALPVRPRSATSAHSIRCLALAHCLRGHHRHRVEFKPAVGTCAVAAAGEGVLRRFVSTGFSARPRVVHQGNARARRCGPVTSTFMTRQPESHPGERRSPGCFHVECHATNSTGQADRLFQFVMRNESGMGAARAAAIEN
jgi:hypothetical protein